jgi:hypothetical protein
MDGSAVPRPSGSRVGAARLEAVEDNHDALDAVVRHDRAGRVSDRQQSVVPVGENVLPVADRVAIGEHRPQGALLDRMP